MLARVLVVDDDPKILSLLRRGLNFAGYVVDLAADGEEALVAARDRPPDVVVLDLMLPGVDGLEVCRRLRLGDASLPILMLTA
jgi:DNA-binding response OmpR family regulator